MNKGEAIMWFVLGLAAASVLFSAGMKAGDKTEYWKLEAIKHDAALFCAATGEWAWKGECPPEDSDR